MSNIERALIRKSSCGLLLVGEEADVLLDRHPLLPHERDRPTGRGLADRERRHPVEVDHRPDELVDEEAVLGEALVLHGGDGNASR